MRFLEPDQDWNTHVYNCPGAGKPEQTGHCSLMSVKSLSIVFKSQANPFQIQACYYCELILVSMYKEMMVIGLRMGECTKKTVHLFLTYGWNIKSHSSLENAMSSVNVTRIRMWILFTWEMWVSFKIPPA